MPRPGELHHKARLTEELVRKIRELRDGGMSYVAIAEEIGWVVELNTIRAAATRKTWRHVR